VAPTVSWIPAVLLHSPDGRECRRTTLGYGVRARARPILRGPEGPGRRRELAEKDEDEFGDAEESDLEEPDEAVLDEEIVEDDLEVEGEAEVEDVDVLDADVEVVEIDDAGKKSRATTNKTTVTENAEEEDDAVLELEEEAHPDDVEEPLDVLLKERTAKATLEDDEEEVEEEEIETDERGEAPAKIVPRRPGEFLCTSCFLVLPRNQLADEKRMLCRDCA
jgi:hypothetical protein